MFVINSKPLILTAAVIVAGQGVAMGAGSYGMGSTAEKLAADRSRRLRAKSDQLEAAASIIKLPRGTIEQALAVLHQVRSRV